MELVSLLGEDIGEGTDGGNETEDGTEGDDNENSKTDVEERIVLRPIHGPVVTKGVCRALRRRSSAQSSDGEDDPNETDPPKPKNNARKRPAALSAEDNADVEVVGTAKVGDYSVWYAGARMQAFRKKPGEIGEPACMMICDDPSGFMKFEWPDGMQWTSKEPH